LTARRTENNKGNNKPKLKQQSAYSYLLRKGPTMWRQAVAAGRIRWIAARDSGGQAWTLVFLCCVACW
jgi:hypothetical protein